MPQTRPDTTTTPPHQRRCEISDATTASNSGRVSAHPSKDTRAKNTVLKSSAAFVGRRAKSSKAVAVAKSGFQAGVIDFIASFCSPPCGHKKKAPTAWSGIIRSRVAMQKNSKVGIDQAYRQLKDWPAWPKQVLKPAQPWLVSDEIES